MIDGVGPDAPTVQNEKGAKQSHVPYRIDLFDVPSVFRLAKILSEGSEKYGVDNWRGLSVEDNLNHVLVHVFAYLGGDTQDDHLGHALCRMMFATGIEHRNKEKARPLDVKVSAQDKTDMREVANKVAEQIAANLKQTSDKQLYTSDMVDKAETNPAYTLKPSPAKLEPCPKCGNIEQVAERTGSRLLYCYTCHFNFKRGEEINQEVKRVLSEYPQYAKEPREYSEE